MTAPFVVIPALSTGNLAAVANMVRKVGGQPCISNSPGDLCKAQRIIIAGVGAFDAGMQSLKLGGWLDSLNEVSSLGKTPILGICLGMQLMCCASEEGAESGLGWFEAQVRRIVPEQGSKLKVPHMGWNTLSMVNPCSLFSNNIDQHRFYFCHSYHVTCDNPEDEVAFVTYGFRISAAISRGNIYGVQFHPEKSHRFGAELIERFINLGTNA